MTKKSPVELGVMIITGLLFLISIINGSIAIGTNKDHDYAKARKRTNIFSIIIIVLSVISIGLNVLLRTKISPNTNYLILWSLPALIALINGLLAIFVPNESNYLTMYKLFGGTSFIMPAMLVGYVAFMTFSKPMGSSASSALPQF